MKKGNQEDLIRFYVERSFTTLKDAKVLGDSGGWTSCINRLYYACFYIVYALLLQKIGVRTKTHSGVKTLFSKHIVKPGLVKAESGYFYSLLMEKRGEGDYGDFEIFTAEEVLPLILQAEEFIITIQKLIL